MIRFARQLIFLKMCAGKFVYKNNKKPCVSAEGRPYIEEIVRQAQKKRCTWFLLVVINDDKENKAKKEIQEALLAAELKKDLSSYKACVFIYDWNSKSYDLGKSQMSLRIYPPIKPVAKPYITFGAVDIQHKTRRA